MWVELLVSFESSVFTKSKQWWFTVVVADIVLLRVMWMWCHTVRLWEVCNPFPSIPTRSDEKRCAFGTSMSFCTWYVLPRYEVDMGLSVVRRALDGCITRHRLWCVFLYLNRFFWQFQISAFVIFAMVITFNFIYCYYLNLFFVILILFQNDYCTVYVYVCVYIYIHIYICIYIVQ